MNTHSKLFGLTLAAFIVSFLWLSMQVAPAYSDSGKKLVIIVNKSNSKSELTTTEVERIFLGKVSFWANGASVRMCDLTEPSAGERDSSRAVFARRFLHKELMTLKSYWIKMIFSGKGRPPNNVKTASDVVKFVVLNKGGIGYVRPQDVTSEVKVVKISGTLN